MNQCHTIQYLTSAVETCHNRDFTHPVQNRLLDRIPDQCTHSQRFGMSQNLRLALTVLYIGKSETTHTETLHIPPRTGYLTESQISVLTVKGLECPRTYVQYSKLGVNTGR